MRHAARGTRNLDTGAETVADQSVRAQLRRQARKVFAEAILFGAALTALGLLLPG